MALLAKWDINKNSVFVNQKIQFHPKENHIELFC